MSRKTFRYQGKRYDITGKDDTELAVKVALKKKSLEDGTVVINKNTLVSKWTEDWLATYKKDSVGKGTYELYDSIVTLHIVPAIGNLRLHEVQKINLQKILNSRVGYSKSHIIKVKQTIQQIFKEAKAGKLISDNPAEYLTMPKSSDGNHRKLTDKERTFILELAETHYSGLWIKVMLYTGLRPQETATLQWRNIDLKKKRMKIDTASEALTNNIKEPKSAAGKREIPIPDILVESLLKVKGSPFDYVFVQPTTGNRHTKSSMRCLWHHFKRDLNIAMGTTVYRNQLIKPYAVADDLVPYCLRHTYCTDLQDAGIPINIAKEFMGHSDISTTSKIYTHKSEIAFNNASEMINKFNDPNKDKGENKNEESV